MVNGAVRVTLLTDTPTGPVLVICTFCAALVVPTVTEPKDRPVGETATEPDAVLDAVTVTASEVATLPAASRATDRKSVVKGKRVDLGGRRIIKKKMK